LAEIADYFAGDFPLPIVLNPSTTSKAFSLQTIALPDSKACALILFTSGSTSEPTPISKSFAQLEAELETLESQWGSSIAGSTITSTVSHHHIYGLLFRLLWPLCANRPFLVHERDYWEELAKDADVFQPLAIISSPAHLSRIPPVAWPASASLAAIFSSGGPLLTAASLAAKLQLGQAVTEVYGSTETGGIAWREQDKNSSWTCLPGVEINLTPTDSLLQIRSGHLPDRHWFNSADRATPDEDGRFNLCGRADRIVKVGGKRISLSAIERILEQQIGVAQARVVHLPDRGDRLGAVVVLDNDGNKRLVDQGKAVINQQLKSVLETQIDRIAIPRYWRYLGELPQNRQGKTTLAELQALFDSEPLPRLPDLVNRCQEQDALLLELFIPANLYYFDGHFPGRPVLPGVVQTHWAVHYAREQWGNLGAVAGLEAIKFQQIITANQTIQLKLSYQPDKGKLYFNYTGSHSQELGLDIAYASGRVLFMQGQV
jgi:acyl-coenzyme A synthetase/AMP-(fatty) acid ligase/3-hydroxymyristoyl/3-hydroxydecanoyl-(acyl carrier protein) dehydratase